MERMPLMALIGKLYRVKITNIFNVHALAAPWNVHAQLFQLLIVTVSQCWYQLEP